MFSPYVQRGVFPSENTEENAIFTYISIQSANIIKILENVIQNGREKILLKIKTVYNGWEANVLKQFYSMYISPI